MQSYALLRETGLQEQRTIYSFKALHRHILTIQFLLCCSCLDPFEQGSLGPALKRKAGLAFDGRAAGLSTVRAFH